VLGDDVAKQLNSSIESGRSVGMHRMDFDLARLAVDGMVSDDVACGHSVQPDKLRTEIRRLREHPPVLASA
jgi:Tfp pilus assembly pilus retraction ATPase PilT